MKTSESVKNIAPAFHKAQCEMQNAKLNKINPYHKSRYGDLESVLQAVKKPLNDNGLFVTQEAVSNEESVSVITRVYHTSGEYFEYGPLITPIGKRDAHATGSSVTYSKRYQLSAIFSIVADEDDDGNAAQDSAKHKKKEKKVATSKEMDAFMGKHAKTDKELDLLQEFLDKYTKHYEKTIPETIGEFIQDEINFQGIFQKWKKDNNKC